MRIRSLIAAAAMACAAAVSVAPAAHADGGTFVNFGDSIASNPTVGAWAADKANRDLHIGDPAASGINCATDPNNYAAQSAGRMGLRLVDYSCTGTTAFSGGQHLSEQVDKALASGALNGDTRVVTITVGFNDTYPYRSNNSLSEQEIHDRYVGAVADQINRIRAAAPQATIKNIGYSQIADGDFVCLNHFGMNVSDRIPFPLVNQVEQLTQRMQIDVANVTGTQFVDIKPSSAGHGLCADDANRWVAGVIDFPVVRNMPLHLTDHGQANVAEQIMHS